jgi:NodT family efflux transporter outer membrane factor (OMF) lipoprotein
MVMRDHRSRLAILLALVSLTAACTVGPDYKQPVVEVPDVWEQNAVEGVEQGEAAIQTWWENLGDPQLVDLLERAEDANLDLRQAIARISEARALRRIAGGERYPDINAEGDAGAAQFSKSTLGEMGGETFETYSLGVGLTWEIDVFGRIRRSVESATAGYEASIENYRDVLVTLFSDVARNYVDVRTLQERIDLAEANVELQKSTMELTQVRFDTGLTSALDTAQAESNLANTEARIPTLETQLNNALNRLAVLLGEVPGSLDGELDRKKEIPSPPDEVVVGIPADVVRQRPDIRRAERDLASQTARIGVATADLYPRFSITGFLGLSSSDIGDLFSGDAVTWDIGLPLFANLFDGGRVRGQIEVEEARTEALLAAYELTVLGALEEVEDALVAYAKERIRRDTLQRAVEATQRSVDLVKEQYMAGLTDFQNVLDSQRSLSSQEDQLAESEGQVVNNLIGLYTALGGGWRPDPEQAETLTTAID